jgi:hypothetical protein
MVEIGQEEAALFTWASNIVQLTVPRILLAVQEQGTAAADAMILDRSKIAVIFLDDVRAPGHHEAESGELSTEEEEISRSLFLLGK